MDKAIYKAEVAMCKECGVRPARFMTDTGKKVCFMCALAEARKPDPQYVLTGHGEAKRA